MSRARRAGVVASLVLIASGALTLLAPASAHATAARAPAGGVTRTAIPGPVASAATLALTGPLAAPAAPGPAVPAPPAPPDSPSPPTGRAGSGGDGSVSVDINGIDGKPSSSILVILAITVLSVAPAVLLMMTSFTKIIVVLGLTRNALGLQNTPPNQVLAGLALFLSLFVMGPVLADVNTQGVQPYLNGTVSASVAFERGVVPLRGFMFDHTRSEELALMTKAAHRPMPADRSDVELTTLIPAFVLSELKSAFIIGFVVFVPFLVIDLVVSASLMSMGMMMLPPVVISLPFKLLLFVLVDGWGLVVTSLVSSYSGGGG